MFGVGDTIMYSTVGVCKIRDICENKLTGVLRSYYVLCPIDSEKNMIYVPQDNEKLVARMRVVPTKKHLKEILDRLKYAEIDWIDNNLERAENYHEILVDGDVENNIRLLHTLHKRYRQLLTVGRHLPKSDERIYKDCSRLLSSELSLILNLEPYEALQLLLLED